MAERPGKQATLYRMVMDDHICPYGLKSKDLLERKGYAVDDHHLKTREETDAFKEQHGVETTPQTFIDGQRIGGYDDLRVHFGKDDPADEDATTYQPVIAIFAMGLLLAVAAVWGAHGELRPLKIVEWFIAFSMALLAVQKLRDLEGFSLQFLNYDLLAQRWVRYAWLYPFGEAIAAIGMIAMVGIPFVAAIALFIGTVGAVSVFKAVYVDKRELKCACVGGGSSVPLGFISLTENLMMVGMALWMLWRY